MKSASAYQGAIKERGKFNRDDRKAVDDGMKSYKSLTKLNEDLICYFSSLSATNKKLAVKTMKPITADIAEP